MLIFLTNCRGVLHDFEKYEARSVTYLSGLKGCVTFLSENLVGVCAPYCTFQIVGDCIYSYFHWVEKGSKCSSPCNWMGVLNDLE